MKPQASLATPGEVARYLQIPEKSLSMWRYRGTGPKWRKIGRHIRYRWTDVYAYETANESGGGRDAA